MSALKQSVKRHLRAVKDHLGLSTHAAGQLMEEVRAAARPPVDPATTFPLQNRWEPSYAPDGGCPGTVRFG